MAAADLDGDGDLDLVSCDTVNNALYWYENDGKGNFTNAVTLNDNGTVTHLNDFGTYTVNADCTGKIGILGGTGTIEIVLVDGGKEFYGSATDPGPLFPSRFVTFFSAAKKQFPDHDDNNHR